MPGPAVVEPVRPLPPASSTSSRPAAQSQCCRPRSKKRVHAAGGQPGQVERRGAGAADVAGAREQLADHVGLHRAALGLVGEAGGHQRLLRAARAAGALARRASLARSRRRPRRARRGRSRRGSASAPRPGPPVGVLERHAHRPGREAVEEVDRAVERVDDPAPAAGGLRARALLGHQAVVGPLGRRAARGSCARPRGRRPRPGRWPTTSRPPPRAAARSRTAAPRRPRARALGQLEVRVHRARSRKTIPTTTAATTST